MIADTIRFVLTNVPLILVALTLVFALLRRPSGERAEHWLGWVLFFAVGADALWAGLYHVFAPHTAARFIGWQVSPFQFEIGVADIAMGLTAMAALWRPVPFRQAIALYAIVFYVGVAYGHIHEVLTAGNFAPGNMGALFAITIGRIAVLAGLLWAVRGNRSALRPAGPVNN